jgi:ribosomal 50S subunit-associated protein YjgA (DUF615 family)
VSGRTFDTLLAQASRLREKVLAALPAPEGCAPPKNYREIFQVLREIIPEPQPTGNGQ